MRDNQLRLLRLAKYPQADGGFGHILWQSLIRHRRDKCHIRKMISVGFLSTRPPCGAFSDELKFYIRQQPCRLHNILCSMKRLKLAVKMHDEIRRITSLPGMHDTVVRTDKYPRKFILIETELSDKIVYMLLGVQENFIRQSTGKAVQEPGKSCQHSGRGNGAAVKC